MIDTAIIINDQAYISGGLAKIAINSAIELQKKGIKVIFFYAIGPIDERLQESGVECISIDGEHIGKTKNVIHLLRGLWNKKAKMMLEKILKKENNEKTIVHIHGWTKAISSSIFSVLNKYRYKTFITLHDYFLVCQNGGLFNYKKDTKCNLQPGSLKCYLCNCDKKDYITKIYRNIRQIIMKIQILKLNPEIIYISEFSKNILKQKGLDFKKEHIIYNHVEIKDEKRISVEKNEKYVFIGRLTKDKGVENFCEAIKKCNVEGMVIGDGPLLEEFKYKYPNIQFVGWLNSNEMDQYLKQVRAMIVTSKWYETMGLTIIEMQSKGIPCIVPNDFAGSAYIENENTGLYYNIDDMNSLIDCIEKFNCDEIIEKISKNFFNKLDKKKFDIQQHINSLITVYNKKRSIEVNSDK